MRFLLQKNRRWRYGCCGFRCFKDGYCSDMTRTLLFGNVSEEHMRIFNLVQESQDKAIAAIRPGVMAKDVEDAHRAVFLRENLDDYALRGLGHGIGLQIHECPRIVIGNETVLKPGMILRLNLDFISRMIVACGRKTMCL